MPNARTTGFYLNEWLALLEMRQRDLATATLWSQAYVSMLCSGKIAYSRRNVEIAAAALGLHPSELLMHPSRALLIRRKLGEG